MHEELIERLKMLSRQNDTALCAGEHEVINDAIAALSQPSGNSGQLAEWKLVPIAMTEAMHLAYWNRGNDDDPISDLLTIGDRAATQLDWEAMLAAAPPPPAAAPSGWLPIESAPKNKRIALGWDYLKTQAPCFGQWDEDQYAKKPRPFWRTDVDRYRGLNEERRSPPSHWMDITPPAPRDPSP